jgi:hypothetical protein
MINDYSRNPYGDTDKWMVENRQPLLNSQGVFIPRYDEPVVYNTGVVVCSRHHDIWNGMTKIFPMEHCDEQFWIEYQALRYPIYNLHQRFNNQYWYPRWAESCKDSHIIHYSGAPNNKRVEMMQQEVVKWHQNGTTQP